MQRAGVMRIELTKVFTGLIHGLSVALVLASCVSGAQHDAVVRDLLTAKAFADKQQQQIEELHSELSRAAKSLRVCRMAADGTLVASYAEQSDSLRSAQTESEQRAAEIERLRSELSRCQGYQEATQARVKELEAQRHVAPPPAPPRQFGTGRSEYVIEVADNDDTFVINGEVFKAKTYCFGISTGERVLFLEGNANGVCTTAKFVVLGSGKVCDVWCE